MGFSVLQTEPVLPDEDALVYAYSKIEALTHLDAKKRAKGVAGWIAWDLEHPEAMAVLVGLAERNVGAAIVVDEDVPELPTGYRTRKVTAGESGFTVPDALNRPMNWRWNDVAVVAGGVIQRTEVSGRGLTGAALGSSVDTAAAFLLATGQAAGYGSYRSVRLSRSFPSGRSGRSALRPAFMPSRARSVIHNHFELILHSGQRFTLEDARVEVQDPIPGSDIEDPGVALATAFAHAAPAALVNAGIQQAVDSSSLRAYRSLAVLERETRWLMWLLNSIGG